MAQLQRSDIIKLAELSALKLSESEINSLLKELQDMITYVDQLSTITLNAQDACAGNKNVFREDNSIKQDSAPLLAQAPEAFETYFVVPQIVDSSKDAS